MAKIDRTSEEFARLCQELAVLNYLTLEVLDKIGINTLQSGRFKSALKDVNKQCENTMEEVFNIKAKEIRQGTYFQELTAKVEEVIKENYKFIG